jgi:hypothetical protein
MAKIRSGYRVIGHNTSDGQLSCWHFPTQEFADKFAQVLCEDTGEEVDVCKYIGSWRVAKLPTEFIAAEEVESLAQAEGETK